MRPKFNIGYHTIGADIPPRQLELVYSECNPIKYRVNNLKKQIFQITTDCSPMTKK